MRVRECLAFLRCCSCTCNKVHSLYMSRYFIISRLIRSVVLQRLCYLPYMLSLHVSLYEESVLVEHQSYMPFMHVEGDLVVYISQCFAVPSCFQFDTVPVCMTGIGCRCSAFATHGHREQFRSEPTCLSCVYPYTQNMSTLVQPSPQR